MHFLLNRYPLTPYTDTHVDQHQIFVDQPRDFDGWNCGKITTCGRFGPICGGYDVKGKNAYIQKTFNLPEGAYSVELDFIKIDSW